MQIKNTGKTLALQFPIMHVRQQQTYQTTIYYLVLHDKVIRCNHFTLAQLPSMRCSLIFSRWEIYQPITVGACSLTAHIHTHTATHRYDAIPSSIHLP